MSAETLTRPDEDTRERADDGTGGGPNEVFHYVRKPDITRSAVEGGHVVALCGETFPVTKAARPGSPVCSECKRLHGLLPA